MYQVIRNLVATEKPTTHSFKEVITLVRGTLLSAITGNRVTIHVQRKVAERRRNNRSVHSRPSLNIGTLPIRRRLGRYAKK